MPSRDGAKRTQPNKRIKPFRAVFRAIAVFIMICTISGCIVASVMTVYVINTLDQSDAIILEDIELGFSTIIFGVDKTTNEYVELQKLQTNVNRIWVDYDEIPQTLKDAAIAVEDKRFWAHSGVDIIRTVSAALNYFNPARESTYGGSTITQQLVKNATGDDLVDINRKIEEVFRAINLEKTYSKEQILEVYLNTIALGNGQNGVQSASLLYFGKEVSELTLAESASLIAITQNPWKWDPFQFPEKNRDRQLTVLFLMHAQLLITDEEYEEAIDQEMVFKSEEYTEERDRVYSWFIDYVYDEVIGDFVTELGYTEDGAKNALTNEGFKIYSTVDIAMQQDLEENFIYTNEAIFPAVNNEEYPEGAFVVLGLDGRVHALVGSNREKDAALLFSRATDATRQPGSTIKPLTSYSLAVERDLINWSMMWEDSPVFLDKDPLTPFPSNFYGHYEGPMTIQRAVQRSTNTIPVKLVQLLNTSTSFAFMQDSLGFENLVTADMDISPMALGALTNGVTPLEMAAAYQMFGNGGFYNEPYAYTKVVDAEGNVILENKAVSTRVLTPETASIMNQLLQKVTVAGGTGAPANLNTGMPVAGKTGTSDKDHDQWFIGVTPYYVGVCWLGFDIAETISYNWYPPPLIWKNVMTPIHEGLEIVPFNTWGNVVQRTFCMETGGIATPACLTTSYGWYKLMKEVPDCPLHSEEELDVGDLPYWSWLYPEDEEDDDENGDDDDDDDENDDDDRRDRDDDEDEDRRDRDDDEDEDRRDRYDDD